MGVSGRESAGGMAGVGGEWQMLVWARRGTTSSPASGANRCVFMPVAAHVVR